MLTVTLLRQDGTPTVVAVHHVVAFAETPKATGCVDLLMSTGLYLRVQGDMSSVRAAIEGAPCQDWACG